MSRAAVLKGWRVLNEKLLMANTTNWSTRRRRQGSTVKQVANRDPDRHVATHSGINSKCM